MTLTFSSLEEAWGGKTQLVENKSSSFLSGFNPFPNVSEKTKSSVHSTAFEKPHQQYKRKWGTSSSSSNQNYQNVYCDEIVNHVQGCSYCQQKLRSLLSTPGSLLAQPCSQQDETRLSPKVLERKNDNLAYVPFGLDPEVFNILLFSIILIALILLIDKKGTRLKF